MESLIHKCSIQLVELVVYFRFKLIEEHVTSPCTQTNFRKEKVIFILYGRTVIREVDEKGGADSRLSLHISHTVTNIKITGMIYIMILSK